MDYLGDDGVPVSLDGLLPPGRKGNTVQLVGNPIISATNRGLSWKLLPMCSKVGSSPWKSRKSVRPLGFFSPSSVSCMEVRP